MLEQAVIFPVVLVAMLLGHPEQAPEIVSKPLTQTSCLRQAKDLNAKGGDHAFYCGVIVDHGDAVVTGGGAGGGGGGSSK